MIRPIGTQTYRASLFGILTLVSLAGGCAPSQFSPAIAFYAEQSAVTDAASRHTSTSPYYRFNSAILSDLDDALKLREIAAQRTLAATVLRDANALALTSTTNEIERMPPRLRKTLANPAKLEPSVSRLKQHYAQLASEALKNDLRDVEELSSSELTNKLWGMRLGVQLLTDDRGRAGRQILYSWAVVATAVGMVQEEASLPEKNREKTKKVFRRVAVWRPSTSGDDSLLARYAPVFAVEWPEKRSYDVDDDRIGAVKLSGNRQRIEVRIDPSEPTVYSYNTTAKIDGQRLRQLNYVWWFPERPEMVQDDPAAGHIDGAMLRITLDGSGNPIIVESSLNCGCGHVVFVSNSLESSAREAFGSPLPGKRFSVEKNVFVKKNVFVIGTFDESGSEVRPIILSAAGYHEVCQVRFNATESLRALSIAEDDSYRLAEYNTLDRLPFGDGIASMFGPDGLVHYAGRPEGYLFAPSGILSAGQPRKRGTQRIRWDDYLHDDPCLLEKTLRIPPLN
ncbi:MAG: hypothetical protein GXP29_11825 [Planctomycetes bacterium]|nr:hypothetical protein [Planctomycetota bacterium]